MNNFTHIEQPPAAEISPDVFADPVGYLAGFGIEAELMAESDSVVPMAA